MSFLIFWAVLQTSLHLEQVKIGSRFCCLLAFLPLTEFGTALAQPERPGWLTVQNRVRNDKQPNENTYSDFC